MKRKLTITIDEAVIPRAKRYARRRGVSLSAVVEEALVRMTEGGESGFVERWQGRFEPLTEGDERYRALAEKYL